MSKLIDWSKDDPIEESYLTMETIGQGLFGVVTKCQSLETGLVFASKKIDKRRAQRKLGRSTMKVADEVNILKMMKHPNLMQLEDVHENRSHLFLILEYVSGGELLHRLAQSNHMTEKQTIPLIKGVLCGLEYLHSLHIVHRDLKPENILLNSQDFRAADVKIIDFGLAYVHKEGTDPLCSFVGTVNYMAPEMYNMDGASFPADIWAVGCITYLLLSGKDVFDGADMAEVSGQIQDYKDGELFWDEDFEEGEHPSDLAKDFVTKLLTKNHKSRPTATECLSLPCFEEKLLEELKDTKIDLSRLKSYNAQKRWKKAFNTIRAIYKMTSILSSVLGKPKNVDDVIFDVADTDDEYRNSDTSLLSDTSLSTPMDEIPEEKPTLSPKKSNVALKASMFEQKIEEQLQPKKKLKSSESVSNIIKPLMNGERVIQVYPSGVKFLSGVNGIIYTKHSREPTNICVVYTIGDSEEEKKVELPERNYSLNGYVDVYRFNIPETEGVTIYYYVTYDVDGESHTEYKYQRKKFKSVAA